jgi:very-short-patch-repair endonuclease
MNARDQLARERHRAAAERLERTFLLLWDGLRGPRVTREHKALREATGRLWRFDFAIPEARVLIEIEGGTWSGGRHTRGTGFAEDCAKYNAAAVHGWTVFRLTGEMIDRTNVEPILAFTRERIERIGP